MTTADAEPKKDKEENKVPVSNFYRSRIPHSSDWLFDVGSKKGLRHPVDGSQTATGWKNGRKVESAVQLKASGMLLLVSNSLYTAKWRTWPDRMWCSGVWAHRGKPQGGVPGTPPHHFLNNGERTGIAVLEEGAGPRRQWARIFPEAQPVFHKAGRELVTQTIIGQM
jgi:hypothetical protein